MSYLFPCSGLSFLENQITNIFRESLDLSQHTCMMRITAPRLTLEQVWLSGEKVDNSRKR